MYGQLVSDGLLSALGWVGTVAATGLFLSPAVHFYRIVKKRDVEDYSSVPYSMSALQCALWVLYAVITPNRLQPLITNIIGVTLQLAYLIIYFVYSRKRAKQHKELLLGVGISMVMLGAVAFFILFAMGTQGVKMGQTGSTQENQTNVLGVICVVFNIFMYMSPLSVMRIVIKTKSVEFMPFMLTAGCLGCSFTWLAYGICVPDINILIPNGAGAVLGLVQLILYGTYYSGGGSDVASNKQSTYRKEPLLCTADNDTP